MVTTQSTISDELFVGRVPELAKEPFYNLKKLTFEADKFPRHVANFLIGRATSIEELNVILDGLNQDQFKGKPKLYVQSTAQKTDYAHHDLLSLHYGSTSCGVFKQRVQN